MNPRLKKIATILFTLLPVAIFLMPNIANASWWEMFSPGDIMFTALAFIANQAMTISAWYLSVCGVFLNAAITATLNIKDLVGGSGGVIADTWRTLRDLSSIAIIFMLLWASISIIIDIKGPKFGELIKNIVLVGLLINFSLFFTNIAVDASNLVSLSFYRAITPAYSDTGMKQISYRDAMDGGISNIFMQSLQIQKIYEPSKQLKGSNPKLNVIIAGIGGSVLMLIAGTSFVFAALAFLIRIGIILLLMVFSPVYFIGWIVPEVSKWSQDWMKHLRAQCLFMPVYLAFLYVSMRIISNEGFMRFLNPSSGSTDPGAFTNLPFIGSTTGVILQYVVAIIMINVPLMAAMDVGGVAANTGKKVYDSLKGWGQGKIQGAAYGAVAGTGAWAGRKFIGGAGQYLDDKLDNKNWASGRVGKAVRSVTTGAMAGGKYGGSQTRKEYNKEDDAIKAKYVENNRRDVFDRLSKQSYVTPLIASAAHKNALKDMKEKERVALGKKNLMNTNVLKWLKESDFEAIKKDTEHYSEQDVKDIMEKRYDALEEAVADNDKDAIKFMVKNMTAKDLTKNDRIKTLVTTATEVTDHLTANQLKDMQSELTAAQRVSIAGYILTKPIDHSAYGNILKNRTSWGV